jgi:hypothetical protein
MVWGTFTLQHMLSLISIIFLTAALHFILKNADTKIKQIVLFSVSLAGTAAVFYDLLRWGQPLLYLPLHLCSLNALIIPFAVAFKNKVLAHLNLIWSLGAMLVLIVNTGQANYVMFSEAFWIFIVCHSVDVAVPTLMFTTGLIEFNFKKTPAAIGITMAAYTGVHFINIGINEYLSSVYSVAGHSRAIPPRVNYMYSLGDEGNAAFALFRKIIPADYWHMYMIVPIIAVFLLSVHYGIKLSKSLKAKRAQNQE